LPVVNLNQATEQQLLTLKGIGKKRAAAIVTYRQSHGKFQALQDLAAVPGMSKNLLDKITEQNEHRVAL
jgi:competence protein ComEA